MKPKHVITSLVVVLLLLLAAAGIYLSGPARQALPGASAAASAPASPAVAAPGDPAVTAPQTAPVLALPGVGNLQSPGSREAATVNVSEEIADGLVTQTFTLHKGWNAVYLGVEPNNPSGLKDSTKPELGYNESLPQAVFGALAANGGPLESVWTYTQPASHVDYIIDPGEGLWDAPGWERWVPKENLGPDNISRGFLTTLYSLHANTGYLVKLKDAVGTTGTFQVSGKPVPGHPRWKTGAYNLAGFPIDPLLSPSLGTLAPSTSPILEVRGLTDDGKWTIPLGSTDTLAAGTAYLIRYSDDPDLKSDYIAPLDLRSKGGGALPSEGLVFTAGLAGNSAGLQVKNLSGSDISAVVLLPEGQDATVALNYVDAGHIAHDLRADSESVPLTANDGAELGFVVSVGDQATAGETILEVSCAALGTRWLVPVSAAAGSHDGLWVGDAIVNNVSEARLGTTDIEQGSLTVALAPVGTFGVRGSAELQVGSTSTAVRIALTLPEATAAAYTQPTPTGKYVHGYVFVDANQNGQRDTSEEGLVGLQVILKTPTVGDADKTTQTQADGSYLFANLTDVGSYSIALAAEPTDYTDNFYVTIPSDLADPPPTASVPPILNSIPTGVVLDDLGATSVEPEAYMAQTLLGGAHLPQYDEYGKRVEPAINFGYVRADTATIGSGYCGKPAAGSDYPIALGTAVNGVLISSTSKTIDALLGDHTFVSIERNGQVACGNIEVGAPTFFADTGRGSQARFRIILRVRDGNAELLPYYVMQDKKRLSAVNFLSLRTLSTMPLAGKDFGAQVTGGGAYEALEFDLTLLGNDPLNPFKHKYNPDHDNLNQKFEPYPEDFPDYKLESFPVDRRISLTLTSQPFGLSEAEARALDWGGAVWGGNYREVVEGLHVNAITASGYFVIRQVVAADDLVDQDYDKP